MAEVTKQWVDTTSLYTNKALKAYATIRDAAVLTSGYVDTNYVNFAECDKVSVKFIITPASLQSIEYKVYQSIDASNWFVEPTETVSSGLIIHAPAYYQCPVSGIGNYQFGMPFTSKYLKASVKGTGTLVGSSLRIDVEGAY